MNQMNNKHSASSADSHKLEILIIAASLICTLIFIWLIPKSLTLFNSGTSGNNGDNYAAVDTSNAEVSLQDSLQSIALLSDPVLPDYWMQGRGTPSGNAGWGGKDISAPFDTLWILDDVGGREFFSAPAHNEGNIYLGCNDGRLRCLDMATGNVKWSFDTPCGICGEPAVDSTMVYFGGQDGTVYALDKNTGVEMWSTALGYHIFCNVAIFSDTLLLTGNSVGRISALDARSGDLIWGDELDGVVLGPVTADSTLVFSTENGDVAAFNSSGRVLWEHSYHSQASPPSASGSSVIVGFSDGYIRNFNLRTGETIFETDITSQPLRCVISRPVIVDSLIFAGTCDSRLVCIGLYSGELVWQQNFENWIQLPPVIGKHSIYVSCDDRRLHVLDKTSGMKLDSIEMGGYSGTAPLLLDNILYYGTTSGEFFALTGSEYIPVIENTSVTAETATPD